MEKVLTHIPRIISKETNKKLIAMNSKEEVRKALFTMQRDKAPGPYKFPTSFFQDNWKIVRNEVVEVVSKFFKKGKLPKSWNSTFISLIPKVTTAKEPKDYISISLCNVLYKIITKILAERRKYLIYNIISREQDGFVKGR